MVDINLENLPDKEPAKTGGIVKLPEEVAKEGPTVDFSGLPDKKADTPISIFELPDSQKKPIEFKEDKQRDNLAKKIMADAWQTAQDIGNLYPVGEAAAHIATNLYGMPLSGLGGLLSLPFGYETANEVMESLRKILIYDPQTKAGKRFTRNVLYPFEALQKLSKWVGNKALEMTNSPALATAVSTAIEGMPAIIALRTLPKPLMNSLKNTQAWRKATIRERGLVVQSLEETLAKNPEITQAELIRKSDSYLKEAIKRDREHAAKIKDQATEADRLAGKKVEAKEPVGPEKSPVEDIFDEMRDISKQEKPVAKGKPAPAAIKPGAEKQYFPLPPEPIKVETITEYEQVIGEAGRRAMENIRREYKNREIGIEREAKKLAREFVEEDPVFAKQTEIIRDGGINRQSFIDAGESPARIAQIIRKRPGVITNKGVLKADVVANELGFDTVTELVEDWINRPTKKQMLEETFEQTRNEMLVGLEKGLDLEFNAMLLDEQINVISEILGKKKPVRRDLKKIIRQKTGQAKVSDIIEVDVGKALKDQIRREAKAAREAFVAGKREATLKHKIRQRALVEKARVRKEQAKRIKKIVKNLKRVDVKRMSPQQAAPVRDLLDGLDLVRRNKKTILKLQRTRDYFENNPESEITDDTLKKLQRLDKRNLNDISLDELEQVHEAVMHHVHLDKLKKSIKDKRRLRDRDTVVKESIGEMKPPPDVRNDIIEVGGSRFSEIGSDIQLLKTTFGIRHDHYDLLIENIAGEKGITFKILYRNIKDGITTRLKTQHKAYDNFKADIDDLNLGIKNIEKWLNEKVKVGKFNIPRNRRMALYRHYLNDDNRTAILTGGFGDKMSKTPDRPIKITREELDAIIDSLSPEEIAIAENPVDNLFNFLRKGMAKVFLEKNGYEFPDIENYYPKEVMPGERSTVEDIEKEDAFEKFRDKWTRIGIDKRNTIERVGSKKGIWLNDLTYDINRAIARSSNYIGLEIPLNEASKLLYDRRFKKAMTERYGIEYWKEIEKGLRDIAGEYPNLSSVEELFMKWKNRLSTSILGLNLFVMAKQPLSFFIYLPYVKSQYLIEGAVLATLNPIKISKTHKLWSPEYRERIESGYSRDVRDVFQYVETRQGIKTKLKPSEKRLVGGKKTLQQKVMSGIKTADQIAVQAGMEGAVLQVLAEIKNGKFSETVKKALAVEDSIIPNLRAIDKLKLAYKYADYATQRTQPMFSPEHRSSLSRGTPTEQLFTQFGAFTNQALNLTRRAYREAIRTGKASDWRKVAKVVFLLFFVNTALVMGIDEARDTLYGRDPKKRNLLIRILSAWASYVFFLRDIVRSIQSLIEKGPIFGDDPSIPIMRIFEILARLPASGVGAMIEEDKLKAEKQARKFIDLALELIFTRFGLPYRTPKKIIQSTLEEEE